MKALSPLASNPAFRPLYLFHAGAINDYLGNDKAAEAHYTALMNIRHMELAVFPCRLSPTFTCAAANRTRPCAPPVWR